MFFWMKPETDKTKVNFSKMEVRCSRVSATEPETKTNVPVTDLIETVLNVLNRDQRTIVTINRNRGEKKRRKPTSHLGDNLDSFDASESFPRSNTLREGGSSGHVVESSFQLSDSSGRFFNKTTRNRSRNSTGRRFHHRDGLMSRLGEVFIVGVCLLTIVRVPAVMSAPSTRYLETSEQIHTHKSSSTHGHKMTEESLNYIYPCGKIYAEASKHYSTTPGEIDDEFFKPILIYTNRALSYAESFRDSYIQETFNLPFEEHHRQWEDEAYDWLPNHSNEIPKRLGTNVDHLHLKKKSLDKFLVEIYEHLQKFAVGLEQVVWDQKRMHGRFMEDFRTTENMLLSVLCEIQKAMKNRNVTPRDNVPRSIMGKEIRQLGADSLMNLRDWLIFRDLMNCLEYMIQAFAFIEENLPKTSATSFSSSS